MLTINQGWTCPGLNMLTTNQDWTCPGVNMLTTNQDWTCPGLHMLTTNQGWTCPGLNMLTTNQDWTCPGLHMLTTNQGFIVRFLQFNQLNRISIIQKLIHHFKRIPRPKNVQNRKYISLAGQIVIKSPSLLSHDLTKLYCSSKLLCS